MSRNSSSGAQSGSCISAGLFAALVAFQPQMCGAFYLSSRVECLRERSAPPFINRSDNIGSAYEVRKKCPPRAPSKQRLDRAGMASVNRALSYSHDNAMATGATALTILVSAAARSGARHVRLEIVKSFEATLTILTTVSSAPYSVQQNTLVDVGRLLVLCSLRRWYPVISSHNAPTKR